jgi:hypothetical protein
MVQSGRILAAEFLAEVAIFVVVIPILSVYGTGRAIRDTADGARGDFLATLWAARHIESRRVLEGVLVLGGLP